MKIIIVGAGEVGTYLAKMLSAINNEIIIIDDSHIDNLKQLDSNYDLLSLNKYPASISALKDANIKKTDLFIAVTPYETENILSCIIAKKLGAKKTAARIDNIEYMHTNNKKFFEELGVDAMIYPEKLAAEEIGRLLRQTGVTKVFDFANRTLTLSVIRLSEKAPIVNKKLSEMGNFFDSSKYRVVAITRNSKTLIPTGENQFKINDLVYFVSEHDNIENVLKHTGKEKYQIKNVMILGGSKIGKKTAKELEHSFNVKLLEPNKQRCIELADFLDNTLVVNTDGRNVNVLLEEGIEKMDAFIAVTGNSETNILMCIQADKLGVKRTIAEIENLDFIDLAANMGIATVINKKLIAAGTIYRYTTRGSVSTVQCLPGTDAEVFEFDVRKGAKITRKNLSNIDFPEGAIIGGIIRNKKSIIANGDCQVAAGDKVVVFTLPEAIEKIQRLFA